MVKSFLALYVGMLVANFVFYLDDYLYKGYFNFMLDDFIYPIKFAFGGAVILKILRSIFEEGKGAKKESKESFKSNNK